MPQTWQLKNIILVSVGQQSRHSAAAFLESHWVEIKVSVGAAVPTGTQDPLPKLTGF